MSDSASRRAEAEAPAKKPKMEEIYGAYAYAMDPYLQAAAFYDRCRTFSAFRPWPKFLAREPPVLQHPERVVRLEDSPRFERSFQPNVALKPLTPPGSDEITSSTSPPPAPPAPPPPDCELSTDSDGEEERPEAPRPPGDAERRLARAEKRLQAALRSLRQKDALIARQSERLEESEAAVRRLTLLLSESEAAVRASEPEKREAATVARESPARAPVAAAE